MDIIEKFASLKGTDIVEEIDKVIEKSKHVVEELIKRNSFRNREKEISDRDYDLYMKMLFSDTYEYNTVYSLVCLMTIISNNYDMKYWTICDKKLMLYNNDFNSNLKLFDVIIDLAKKNAIKSNKIFLLKILKSMQKHGIMNKSKKAFEIITNIEKNENIVYDYTMKNIKINVGNFSKMTPITEALWPVTDLSIQHTDDVITINKNNFYYLMKHTNDRLIRKDIETQYFKHINNIVPLAAKIIILRNMYSKLLKKPTYVEYIGNKTVEEIDSIKMLISDLNNKIDDVLRDNLEIVKTENGNKKIEIHDIVFVSSKLMPRIKFVPSVVMNTVNFILESYFGLLLKKSKIKTVFYKNTDCYELLNKTSGEIYALCIFDIIKRDDKDTKQPTVIKLVNSHNTDIKIVYLLASYKSMTDASMSYSDVVLFFREIGNMLTLTLQKTINGIEEDITEFYSFMANIMELFLNENDILLKLSSEMNREIINRLKLAKNIETIFNMKLKCLSSIFDNIIHGSSDIIAILKESKDNKNLQSIMISLYKKIFDQVFGNISDIFNTNVEYINPTILQNMVNGNQGFIYTSIVSFILAFNSFALIKQGLGSVFVSSVMTNEKYNYKQEIKMFSDRINEDYYLYFLENFMNIKSHKNVINNYGDVVDVVDPICPGACNSVDTEMNNYAMGLSER